MNIAAPLSWFRASRYISLALLVCVSARAFEVDSGSTGVLGALNVTENTTIALPPDGVLNYTTVTVQTGATVTFLRNAANTPVYLLATGDITIEGTIDVSGSPGLGVSGGDGGPGGWGGGNAAQSGLTNGPGKGPGGGKSALYGSYGNPASYASLGQGSAEGYRGSRYGSPLLLPLFGGSGGGGASSPGNISYYGGGGGGGGALLLVSETQVTIADSGSVLARGRLGGATSSSASDYNGGSGGGIRLLAPSVTLNGTLDASGGGYGGAGYIRVDTGNMSQGPNASIQGVLSRGRNRIIFPVNAPSLRLTHVAGNDIPLTQSDEIILNLPPSGQATQPVTVRAEGFNSVVAVSIVLVPESGERVVIDGTIDNRVQNPATRTFNVDFPLDTLVHVHLWTQQTVRSN